MGKILGKALWMVYAGVAAMTLRVTTGWGGNSLLIAALTLVVAGTVAYVAHEKQQKK